MFAYIHLVVVWTLASIAVSALDCSPFKSDKDIIRSLPFRVAINPTAPQPPTIYNYAVVTSQGQVVQLTLTNIANVPLSIFCFQGLESLTLQYSNNLSLPMELFNVTSLRTLSIIGCGLEVLPEAIGQLPLLANLTLTGNRLRSLPPSLRRMTSLMWLTVDGNAALTSLDVLNGHSWLVGLSAANCAIDHLPRNLTYLTTIRMDQNRLRSLDGLDSGAKYGVQSLTFSGNSISSIPASMGQQFTADNLDLSENWLTELPTWVYNVQLKSVNLRNNKFDEKETEWIRGLFRASNTTVTI